MRLLIADDHPLLLDGLCRILSEMPDIQVLPPLSNGHQVIDYLQKNKVDLLLLDLNMPKIDGLSALKIIHKDFPEVKVIVFTSYDHPHFIKEAQALGAAGYLLKTSTATSLKNAVQAVAMGQTWFPKIQKNASSSELLSDDFMHKYQLTPREIEIVRLIAQGKTTRQISDQLSVSEFTINAHRRNIARKTGIDTPIGLLHFAQEQGIV
jgi:DNA-binding NarL/FixJ family response regulator